MAVGVGDGRPDIDNRK